MGAADASLDAHSSQDESLENERAERAKVAIALGILMSDGDQFAVLAGSELWVSLIERMTIARIRDVLRIASR